ncbi:MAG: hypothetical protein AAGD38_00685 [Acidobacteriota bacterium]
MSKSRFSDSLESLLGHATEFALEAAVTVVKTTETVVVAGSDATVGLMQGDLDKAKEALESGAERTVETVTERVVATAKSAVDTAHSAVTTYREGMYEVEQVLAEGAEVVGGDTARKLVETATLSGDTRRIRRDRDDSDD